VVAAACLVLAVVFAGVLGAVVQHYKDAAAPDTPTTVPQVRPRRRTAADDGRAME
jgi:hypothetical protein